MAKLIQDIWHGDSTELCQRFKPERVNCIITDPPFGVDNLSKQAVTNTGKEYARKIANDESPELAIKIFKDVMSVLLTKTSQEADCYVFTSDAVLTEWRLMTREFMPEFGFRPKGMIVWEKSGPGMGDLNNPWGLSSEFILYFQKGKRERTISRRSNVVHFEQVHSSKIIHPHEKPQALLELLIKTSTKEYDFIVDPFGGSGSLAVAARSINRSCIAIEMDDNNYKLAKGRLDSKEDSFF